MYIYIYIIILKPEDVCCLRLTPFVSPLVSDRSIPKKKCNREIREIFTNLAFADTTAVGTEQEIDMFFFWGGIYYWNPLNLGDSHFKKPPYVYKHMFSMHLGKL